MNTALIIIVAVVFLVGTISFLLKQKMKKIPLVDNHARILTLTDKNFKSQLKNKTILVDFWAEWCAPCRMMAPVLNDVAGQLDENHHIGKVDIQQYQALAQEYKIRSIPTLVLFKNGKEVNRFVGVKSKEFLLKQLQ